MDRYHAARPFPRCVMMAGMGGRAYRRILAAFAVVLVATACSGSPAPPGPPPGPTSPGPTSAAPTSNATAATPGCVATTLSALTMRQRVGQVLLVGTPLADIARAKDLVTRYGIGGVFLA